MIKKFKLLTFISLFGSSFSALSQFEPITDPSSDSFNTSGSELILGIWDRNTEISYLYNTGVKFNDIFALNSYETLLNINTSILSDNFEWQVFASDSRKSRAARSSNRIDEATDTLGRIRPGNEADHGERFFTTTNNTDFQYSLQQLEQVTSLTEIAIDVSNDNGRVPIVGTHIDGSLVGWNGRYGAQGDIRSDASINGFGIQEFVFVGIEYTLGGPRGGVLEQEAFTTDLNANIIFMPNGNLIYQSEVPLPAAVWLMLSAITALRLVSRKN